MMTNGTGNLVDSLEFKYIGEDISIYPRARILSPENMVIGDSVIIDDFVFIMGGKSTALGSFIHIASFTSITGGGEFIMEDFSGLSGGIRIYTGNEDYLGGCLTNPAVPFPYRIPIRSYVHIRKHAIIGANAVILPGVEIGEGAVVGANSLVTKDIKPWTINIGSPSHIIRSRPSARIYELEQQLRKDLYDECGKYIPKCKRPQSLA